MTSSMGCGATSNSTSPASSSRHFARFAHEPVQPVAFFVDDRQKLLPLRLFDQAGIREQVRHRGLDRSERSPQRVRDRVEQCGSQAARPGARLRSGRVVRRRARAPWRWRAASRWPPASAGKASCRKSPGCRSGGLPGGRERSKRCSERRCTGSSRAMMVFKLLRVELRDDGAGAIDLLLVREEKRGRAHFESIDDLRGNPVQQLDDVAGFEQAPG